MRTSRENSLTLQFLINWYSTQISTPVDSPRIPYIFLLFQMYANLHLDFWRVGGFRVGSSFGMLVGCHMGLGHGRNFGIVGIDPVAVPEPTQNALSPPAAWQMHKLLTRNCLIRGLPLIKPLFYRFYYSWWHRSRLGWQFQQNYVITYKSP